MPTPHEYFTSVIGKGFDVDGSYGVQCVDGFKHFCKTVCGLDVTHKPICSGTGYATSIWDNYDKYFSAHFDKVPANQLVDGDWAIWTKPSAPCPDSHVAMFRKDNGNGTGIFLGQNQVPGIANYTQVNISYSGLRGGLRPKVYHPAPAPQPAPQPTPAPQPAKKSVDEVAREVIAGKYGNQPERQQRLEAEGYNYAEVQGAVNRILIEQAPQPAPQPTFNVGDAVTIVGAYASSANAASAVNTRAIGWHRYITKIHPGARFPYQIGNQGDTSSYGTTGFADASAIRK